MLDNVEHTTPNKDEIKLIIDNALLEQEKRITKVLNDSLSDQNETYLKHIVDISSRITLVESEQKVQAEKLKSIPALVTTVSAIAASVTGLIGFFIAQFQLFH